MTPEENDSIRTMLIPKRKLVFEDVAFYVLIIVTIAYIVVFGANVLHSTING